MLLGWNFSPNSHWRSRIHGIDALPMAEPIEQTASPSTGNTTLFITAPYVSTSASGDISDDAGISSIGCLKSRLGKVSKI